MGGRWSEEVILDHETLWGRIDLGRWTTGGFSWLVTTLRRHRDRHRMVVDGGAGGGLCLLDVVCLGSEKNSGGEWW